MIQAILNYYRSYFFFQAEDGIRDRTVTGVQTCALPISLARSSGYGGRAYNAFAGRTVPSARTPRLGTFWRVRAFVRDAMDPATQYDAIVIGAGQAGGPLAGALARAGRRSALVERVHVGGTCINEGCTPTKTMVASARVAYLTRRAADYGVHTGPISIDMTKVRQRKRDIVDSFRNGSQRRIEGTEGVDLVMGEVHFTGPKTLEVRLTSGETRQLTAETIFINAGARPSKPALRGLDAVPTLDSTSIMELDTVPEHLLVLGGGYIGLEFGQMF